jgi:hypothetical protein
VPRSVVWILPPLFLAAILHPLGAVGLGAPPAAAVVGAGGAGPMTADEAPGWVPLSRIGRDPATAESRPVRGGRADAQPPIGPAQLAACDADGADRQSRGLIPVGRNPEAPSPIQFRLAEVLSPHGELTGWNLLASGGEGSMRLTLPPESAVRGPVHGWLAVSSDDGSQSEIRLVSPSRGCAHLVHRSDEVIRQAVLNPASGDILFHEVGRSDRADRGIWRINGTGSTGDAAMRVIAPFGADDPVLADVGRVWATGLLTSRDGAWLGVESCGERVCGSRMADLTGRGRQRPSTPGRLVGLDGRWVVSLRDCDGLDCSLVATDHASARERPLAAAVNSAATLERDGRFLVAALGSGPERTLIVADPAGDSRWTASRPEAGLAAGTPAAWEPLQLVSAGGSPVAGAEVPSGWIVAIAGARADLVGLDMTAALPVQLERSR